MENKTIDVEYSEPVDERTREILEESIAQADRGEKVSLEQSTINLRKRIKAWRASQENIAQ